MNVKISHFNSYISLPVWLEHIYPHFLEAVGGVMKLFSVQTVFKSYRHVYSADLF